MSDADPLAEFKAAYTRYKQFQKDFFDYEEGLRVNHPGNIGPINDIWKRKDRDRRVASEGLWVSGVAGLFDLVTMNYKAQALLVEKQLELSKMSAAAADKVAEQHLELAKRNTESAEKMATWTKVLAIVTAILILATIVAGFSGLIATRVTTPADPQSLQSPTHDQ